MPTHDVDRGTTLKSFLLSKCCLSFISISYPGDFLAASHASQRCYRCRTFRVLCVSVCWAPRWVVQKRMNRSWCRSTEDCRGPIKPTWFLIIGQAKATRVAPLFKVTHEGAAPDGAESDVYECFVCSWRNWAMTIYSRSLEPALNRETSVVSCNAAVAELCRWVRVALY